MPRKKGEDLSDLLDVIRRLTEAVERLAGEVQVIREILDRMADDFDWALNNTDRYRPEAPLPPMVVTSMPVDPLARDWRDRLNRLKPADLPDESQEKSSDPPRQGELF